MNTAKNSRKIRGLGLSSGGLDSILSALVLKEQGIDVAWVSFETPFFSAESAVKASAMTGIPVRVEDITETYMAMLKNPPAGYGKNMNPCMDCHSLMFQCAGRIMQQEGYDFLFSGEVAGQRPFSQNKNSMRYVEKHSGFDGHILRPLSAKILPETPVEKKGLVDRSLLHDISGRSRKIQMAMADHFGIHDYPAPAGGCLLTDKGFSQRLRDLMGSAEQYEKRDLVLLRYGRHMRLDAATRLIIGRSKDENSLIRAQYDPDRDVLMRHSTLPSPALLIPRGGTPAMLDRAAAVCAAYTKTRPGQNANIQVLFPGGQSVITVSALDPSVCREFLI